MKIISFTALHYGREYLGYALKSVVDSVDECWILYTDIGSHGFRTTTPCPESRAELYAIAKAVAGDKLRWIDGRWDFEGQQRDAIFDLCPDADVIVVVDADEIWPAYTIKLAIDSEDTFTARYCRTLRVPMVHFWRSFHNAILHDPAYPERIIYPKHLRNETESPRLITDQFIAHMGYAQTPTIVQYKQLTHGHRGQWREGWFDQIFMDENRRIDLHPVGSEFWNVEDVNPLDYMPAFMQDHPFFGMEVIK